MQGSLNSGLFNETNGTWKIRRVDAQTCTLITTVVVAHFLALISPGPDFLLIVRSALRHKRNHAVGVAAGIAVANAVYIVLCMLGVGSLIARSLWLMVGLKVAGACFLMYVAIHAFRAKRSDYDFIGGMSAENRTQSSFFKEFGLGLLSGLSNPKNIIFYISLFAVILTPTVGTGLKIGLGVWMVALIFVWDSMIVFLLGQNRIRSFFGKAAFYIDKAAGAVLGLLGVKLLQSAVKDGA